MRLALISVVFLCVGVMAFGGGPSANGPIGFVKATGEFSMDGSQTRDNATLFNGSVIETAVSPSHATLQDGTRVDLGASSRERVFRDHAVLEKGMTQVHGGSPYAVLANNLRISSADPFRVAVAEPGTVTVTAMDGTAEVKNAGGQLVAMVVRGSSLDFQEANASAPSHFTGCLQKVGAIYVLRDTVTNVVVELTGTGLEKYVGKSVDVTGAVDPGVTPIEGAAQVIRATNLAPGPGKGCRVNIATAGAAGAGAAAAGLSTGTTVAIIGGIATAGTLSGLALAGTFNGGVTPATSNGSPAP
ncbi:MAG: hypothetical protein ABSF98_01385 [Bryobacteraceae bacterium]